MATRPQFLTAIILPILLGTVMAWHYQHIFDPFYFLLTLLAGIFSHAGINISNDYFDHLNRTDEYNTHPLTPFAGGSRVIQKGLFSPEEVYHFSVVLLGLAVILGLLLVWLRGTELLWIGLIGIISGYLYSAPPFAFHSRGLGELLVGLNFGVLSVLGAYFVQTQQLDFTIVLAALPISFLITAVLYINQFPDYVPDKRAGKKNLVVRLGLQKARLGYGLLILLSFISISASILYYQLPWWSWLCLLFIPLGITAIKTLYQHCDKPTALLPAIRNTLALHMLISLCLIFAFWFDPTI